MSTDPETEYDPADQCKYDLPAAAASPQPCEDLSYMWPTDAESEVTPPLTESVLYHIKRAINNLKCLEVAVRKRKPLTAIAQGWLTNIADHIACVQVDVARINGAVLVRGNRPPAPTNTPGPKSEPNPLPARTRQREPVGRDGE